MFEAIKKKEYFTKQIECQKPYLQMIHNLTACDLNATFKPPSGYNSWLGKNESYIIQLLFFNHVGGGAHENHSRIITVCILHERDFRI